MKKNLLKRIVLKNRLTKETAKVANNILFLLLKPLFLISIKIQNLYVKISINRDWMFARKLPNFYKQENNLYSWIKNPSNVHMFVSPAIARRFLTKNSVVLDIGCGDGYIDFLFFSDISKRVEAVDISEKAIKFAKKNFKKDNLIYINKNILNHNFKENYYDYIFWNDSYDYFSNDEKQILIDKIKLSLKENGYLHIKTPINENDPISERNNMKSWSSSEKIIIKEIQKDFKIVDSKITDYIFRKDLDLIASLKNLIIVFSYGTFSLITTSV